MNGITINLKIMDKIRCRIFRGILVEEGGEPKFFNEETRKPDLGYDHWCTQREYNVEMLQFGQVLGYHFDAYEGDKLIHSTYREVEEKPDIEELRKQYKELSGEEADKRWKENKLISEITKLKEK